MNVLNRLITFIYNFIKSKFNDISIYKWHICLLSPILKKCINVKNNLNIKKIKNTGIIDLTTDNTINLRVSEKSSFVLSILFIFDVEKIKLFNNILYTNIEIYLNGVKCAFSNNYNTLNENFINNNNLSDYIHTSDSAGPFDIDHRSETQEAFYTPIYSQINLLDNINSEGKNAIESQEKRFLSTINSTITTYNTYNDFKSNVKSKEKALNYTGLGAWFKTIAILRNGGKTFYENNLIKNILINNINNVEKDISIEIKQLDNKVYSSAIYMILELPRKDNTI